MGYCLSVVSRWAGSRGGFRIVVAALLLLAAAGVLQDSSGTAGAATPTLFVAPGGSDAGVCSRVAPCASFGRAYQVAVPGSVVEVAAGSYPRQTLVFDPSKTSSLDVVFRPAVGAAVTLAEFATGANRVRVGAQHFELRDFTVSSYVRLWWGSEDVTLRNIDAAGIDFASARDVRVLGGDFGPLVDQVSHVRSCGEPGCYPAEDILIEGALFHDYTISYADKHSECLMIWPGRRVTIRNSTFRNCTDFDVFVKPGYELRFENNFFDEPMPGDSATVECNPNCPRGGPALSFSDGSGMTVRYNSFLGAIRLDPEVAGPNSFTGNAGRAAGCWTNATFTYNLWSNTRCSRTDRRAQLTRVFVDPTSSGFDLRLRQGSPAIGAGDPLSAPRTDIEGRVRPSALAADAGAWQREPALARSGRSLGTAAMRMSRAAVREWYGTPRRRLVIDGPKPGQKIQVDSYAIRGGRLRVHYADDRVVAISTTSRYYRTSGALGPGAALLARGSEKRECRRVGKSGLWVRPTRGSKPVVAELIVTARSYTPPCGKPKP